MQPPQSGAQFKGHVVLAEGIKPDSKNLAAIQALSPTTDKEQLLSFLGLVTYVLKFIPKLAFLAALLS